MNLSSLQAKLPKGERSKETIKNMILSLFMRFANIVAHFLVVPLTINYLNAERYGIWLTLSSIIGWVSFFDLGLSNGFRNRFAEAKANNDTALARQYVSTTYAVIGIIVSIVLFVVVLLNFTILDWSKILNISQIYKSELTFVFTIVIVFTCLNMIANIFSTLLTADQKVGYASVIQGFGQYLSLLVIYIISKTTEGSLSNLALYYSSIPCIVMLLSSFVFFRHSRYSQYRPSLSYVKFSLTKKIMNLGVQFFVIQICMLAVFQVVNIVITRELGAESVTEYNIANKYFNIVYMTVVILITPLWSAFTDAYAKFDYGWMQNVYKKLLTFTVFTFFVYLLMLLLAKYAYRVWIGDAIEIPFSTSLAMALFAFVQTYCSVNSYIVNGLGTVRLQSTVFLFFALISWTCLTLSAGFGLVGVILYTTIIYLVIGVLEHIQIVKILNRKAKGFWMK